jgi:HD superfamily phosphohydrolase
MDDYTVWSKLKTCKKSSKIMKDLERRRLLKCAYELEMQAEDKSISSLFGLEGIRSQVEDELAAKAGVPAGEVFIDTPSLPSIPYQHMMDFDPMEIPIIDVEGNSRKVLRATKLSRTIEVLRGFVNIVRVYTYEKNREKVKSAAEKVLGNLPESGRVSY